MALFPHERVMAAAVARRQAEVRSPRVLRFEQNFGPQGVSLLSAGMATVVLGELIVLIALGLMPLSMPVGNGLVALAALVILASSVRFIQAVRFGRTFRLGHRPGQPIG